MMYNSKIGKPYMLDTRDKGIELQSSKNMNFKEDKLNSKVCVKSPYVRGCNLWKQLPLAIQVARTKKELDQLLTNDLPGSLI